MTAFVAGVIVGFILGLLAFALFIHWVEGE